MQERDDHLHPTSTEGPEGRAARRWYERPLLAGTLIFVLAAGMRVAHYAEVKESPLHDDHIYLHDARYYDMLARRAAAGEGLTDDAFFMAPLYPLALSLPYRILGAAPLPSGEAPTYGREIHVAAFGQCVWGAFTCVLIFVVGRRVAGDAAGWIAGLMAALYSMFVFQDSLLMATLLITSVNVAAVLVLLRAERGRSAVWWLLGGLMLGLCILAHGTALLLIPGVLVWIGVGVSGLSPRERVIRGLLVCLAAGSCVALVAVRNHRVGQDWVPLTSNAGLTLFIGNHAGADGSFAPLPTELRNIPGSTLGWHLHGFRRSPNDPSPSENSRRFRQAALEYITTHPLDEARLLWRKFRLLCSSVETGTNDQLYFHKRFSGVLRLPLLSAGVLIPIGLTGVVCSLGRWRRLSLLYVWLAAQIAAYTAMFVLARYRLVAMSCLMVFAAVQLVWWVEWLRMRRYRAVGLSLLLLGVWALFVHWPVEGFSRERGWAIQYGLLAERYAEQGRGDDAIACFEQALQHDFSPMDELMFRTEYLTALAKLYAEGKDWAGVLRVSREAEDVLERMPTTRGTTARRRWFTRMGNEAQAHIPEPSDRDERIGQED
ncbi:MAG: glycosyltransferase family 39 protein [bacterium]|nr:glycosyltransferase family 39 protein [bacterium]